MKKIDLNEIIGQKIKNTSLNKTRILRKLLFIFLNRILHINRINEFIEKNGHLDTKHFIIEIFDYLNYSFLISDSDLQKIPSEGKVICVANHPSSLDSLVILKAFLDVRNDVKIVANDIILNFDFLKDHILPYNLYQGSFQRKNLTLINQALEKGNAIIIFPAAEVSRLKWFRIRDSKWRNGAIRYAQKFNSPILPIYINSKNSLLFYVTSMINKNLATLLLSHEIFNKRNKTTRLVIGDLIPSKAFTASNVNVHYQSKLLKKHVYHIGKKLTNVFTTEKNVIHPIDKKILKQELNNSEFISTTRDGKKVFLTTKDNSPHTLNEIARLRELTFRKVGEGTGKKLDVDKFDSYYSHLVVWDEAELEMVGSYRIGMGKKIQEKYNVNGFYTSSLFNFNHKFIDEILPHSIELGRSFVQEKYWNTYALDYLWQGIGSFLVKNTDIKYMFGPVSISGNYPNHVTALIVFYFNKWYSNFMNLASSKMKFTISEKQWAEYSSLFFCNNAKDDFIILKKMLHLFGYSIPVLYKHYSDLCYEGGVSFLDFGVDPDFKNCVDGLILIDISMIKEDKKNRYLRPKLNEVLLPVSS